ncbi:hypothetical protein EDD71_105101 [Fonticella tunisiensis]|uniref:Uncharacterized protein n=1 Tax=Fonticella tunisiensis TaxID=1096341 RepID=A0A4R7KRB7_9CLOT|nr:hypothetical protein EDD71_105101 [Fonticella tunisiensis]
MKNKNAVILYLKIFLIILIIGFILPYLINLILNRFFIINDRIPPGNAYYVMYINETPKSFLYYIFRLMEKIIDFS